MNATIAALIAVTFLAGILAGYKFSLRAPASLPAEENGPDVNQNIDSYQARYRAAIQIEQREGLRAGIAHIKNCGSPGDYLRYLVDRAFWAAHQCDMPGNSHHLQALNNMQIYVQGDLPDGVYNYQITTGVEDFCLRLIDRALSSGKIS